mmetsp:Transcript_2688/g.3921  ORF Transcript_2688/g.3921 Transcript_2688/m.3921 type:complete len:107 (-) Transcript_2688:34-354(-)
MKTIAQKSIENEMTDYTQQLSIKMELIKAKFNHLKLAREMAEIFSSPPDEEYPRWKKVFALEGELENLHIDLDASTLQQPHKRNVNEAMDEIFFSGKTKRAKSTIQ